MELGSNFDLDLNDLFVKPNNVITYLSNYNTVWFNYGRSAIKSIKIPQGRKVLLPEFICESVISCFPEDDIVFYKVKEDFSIDFNDLFGKLDKNVGTLYICHYFGYLQDKGQLELCRSYADEHNICIIEDTTQSFFSEQEHIGDVVVASLRKWLPIPQGAALCLRGGDTSKIVTHPQQVSRHNTSTVGMILKNLYINEQYDTNKIYREIFTNCEDEVDEKAQMEGISELALFVLKCFDTDKIVEKRVKNAERIKKCLDEVGIENKPFSKGECPLAYPIRVRNRDKLRKYLMDHQIYCAVHWPFDGCQPQIRLMAKRNAEELLSLPIDQRYGAKEIDYLCDVLSKYRVE